MPKVKDLAMVRLTIIIGALLTVSVGALQPLYLNRDANWLRPDSIFSSADARSSFEINEMGLT